jgi:lanosterol synthase
VDGSYRDHRNGGWPFSTKIQGFTVSDCTAEAIKAILMVQNVPGLEYLKDEIPKERLFDGIDVLMSIQNTGTFHYGSFASYERIKGPELLEQLNPAEVFGNIMIEYPYVECTDSSVLGLSYFRKYFDYRADEIDEVISTAIQYIIDTQGPDGSWYGSWGVCHIYAGMFAIEALETQGYSYENSETVRRACDFIVDRQESDGGWSEDFRSCEIFSYVRGPESQVVQSAWATIMLLLAGYPRKEVVEKAAIFLMKKQELDGSWGFNRVEGVFNHSCAIEYPNYKFYFPMKALGMYAKKYGNGPVVFN